MSEDSDETICDNTEYDNRVPESDTPDSPSIFSAAISRANSMKNNVAGDEILQQAEVVQLSPEYLPPSAKMKRLERPSTCINTNNNAVASKDSDTNASKNSCISNNQVIDLTFSPSPHARVLRAKAPNVFDAVDVSVSSTSGENVVEGSKLRHIKKQEYSVEELLIGLEKQDLAGSELIQCPNFLRAKSLLAAVRPQLAEFGQSQQQERSKLLALTQSQSSEECSGVVWSQGDKQRLQELATRQRELLKLFKKYKELVGRLQSLKNADKVNKTHLLPCVEKHFKSCGVTGLCEETRASSNELGSAVSSPSNSCSIPEPGLVHTQSDGTGTNTSTGSALKASSQLVHSPVTHGQSLEIVSSTCSTGVPTGSSSVQPALKQVVLTGGQLYQIGGHQVYVIPKAALPTPVCAIQASVTQATITTTTTAAATVPVVKLRSQLNVPGIQGSSTIELPPISRVPTMAITRQPNLIAEPGLTMGSGSTQAQVSSINSILRSSPFSGSSHLQGKHAASSSGTQVVFSGHGTLSSSNVNTLNSVPSSILHLTESLANKPASNKQRSVPATKCVATPSESTRTTTLVRRRSFESDLPDLKCLLDHGVIEAGPNLVSVQFEGKRFEASLMSSGFIMSTEGETFHTPMAWLKAVSHSKTTWRQAKTYRMISYKGKPLATYSITQAARGSNIPINKTNTTSSLGCSESQFSQENIPDVGQQQCLNAGIRAPPARQDPSQQNMTRNQLMSCHDDLSTFLRNCCVMPISDQEFVPSNTFLPSDFWISKSEVKLPMSLIKELDF